MMIRQLEGWDPASVGGRFRYLQRILPCNYTWILITSTVAVSIIGGADGPTTIVWLVG